MSIHSRSHLAFPFLSRGLYLLLVASLVLAGLFSPGMAAQAARPAEAEGQDGQNAGGQWLSFLPNAGQTDARVRFQAQAMGGTVFFAPDEVVLTLPTGAEPSLKGTLEACVPRTQRTFAICLNTSRFVFR